MHRSNILSVAIGLAYVALGFVVTTATLYGIAELAWSLGLYGAIS
ncbi:hypothetical protein [Gordonia zhaorongruii]|nr:hypothetical protein [Gordonia zhaorongruii]